MKTVQTLLMLGWAAFLGACSAYHPLKGGIGYTELPVGEGYEVTYVGTSDMGVARARQYALIRASELTALAGKSFFEIEGEKIYLMQGLEYVPGETRVRAYPGWGRRGRVVYLGTYEPGYVMSYTVPQVWMKVKPVEGGEKAVPAGYILRDAVRDNVPLSPEVKDLVPTLPVGEGPVTVPAAPQTETRPADAAN